MLNYKFKLDCSDNSDMIFSLSPLAMYLLVLQQLKITARTPPTADTAWEFASMFTSCLRRHGFAPWSEAALAKPIVVPPYPIWSVTPPEGCPQMSFHFEVTPLRRPRLKVFIGGRVNILGANTAESAREIYNYFERLIDTHWREFVVLRPKRDLPKTNA